MTAAAITRLSLTNFRSYHAATLEVAGTGAVVLTGPNGAGKTNLLEAISFFTPGRGLRRATLEEVAFNEGDGAWAVAAEMEGMLGLATLGTGVEPPAGDDASITRQCRIDREKVGSAVAFTDHLRVIWLIPAMDQLFNGPASERRRFFDRLVLAVDGTHSTRINALERSLRSRNRLLEENINDTHWLDAIDRETAELAVAVAAGRVETAARLSAELENADSASPFPPAALALDGILEHMLAEHSASQVEDRYRALLAENRARDAAAGRTLEGPHLTDLAVRFAAKDIPAADASTGEQKAMLIRLILAHSALIKDMTGTAPVLLLDEVVAHLDPGRRAALYDELTTLGTQVWMTGADPALFAEIAGRAEVFDVSPGRVTRRH
ncbi:MAG TPA: DNA replication/repair protein RecF [Pseudolabrys sp.]|jgi:DNA replication and repair protein RecF|nr:DNA replication/repair protein RecF [Pseudolabrys sp.]